MSSSAVNLFHLPSETPVSNEVKFSQAPGDGSEDEDYSASLSAVLRQRRASVRRSRKGRARRPSSPFLADERPRRRSSVFTTSSGDTAISMEEQSVVVTQEQIFENIHLHKEVLGSVKQQPLGMRRKLKIVHQAKGYIKRHEGQLQERLAQSKSTRDIYARFNILLNSKWQQMKREAANTSNLLIPWESRIKEIESHFGSVVASYFTFLRWLFWVNLVVGFILLVFVIVPEYLTANPTQDGERKIIMDDEKLNASNLLTLWEFEGVLKFSPIFYGYYSNIERPQYRMPLAYFLTGLAVYIYSFVAILKKMAENSRMSKLSEKEDECIFSWKLFTGWDFMIGNTETAHNRIASIILGFKEALLEEAEKKKDLRNWRIITLRVFVNICVIILLVLSAYAVVTVVSRTEVDDKKMRNWWRENETTIVVTLISIVFPVFFELLGYLERFHPRRQLRLQLARIMLLNLLNLYSLIFALFSKIDGMSKELDTLKPPLDLNATITPNETLNISESMVLMIPGPCIQEKVLCGSCTIQLNTPLFAEDINFKTAEPSPFSMQTGFTTAPKRRKRQLTKEEKELIRQMLNQATSRTIMVDQEEDDSDSDEYNFYDDSTTDVPETTPGTETESFDMFYDELSTTSTTIYSSTDFTATEDTIGTGSDMTTDHTYSMFSTYDNTETTTDFYTDVESTFDFSGSSTFETTTNDIENTKYETESSTADYTFKDKQTTESTTKVNLIETTPLRITVSDVSRPTSPGMDNIKNMTSSTTLYTTKTSKFTEEHNKDDCQIQQNISLNFTINCDGKYITHVLIMSNGTITEQLCYKRTCPNDTNTNIKNATKDIAYMDEHKRKMYNLTKPTRKKLLKLCWETMFGQELVKLTMMDLVFVLLGTLFLDFFRALLVRYLNRCWCWDLEKKFPEYGDFKIAENILHLINNQGMVWMGMFFSPGLVVLNVVKLMIMMYLRSWAVMTCNVPHEVVFRVSKSNNFYLGLLLTMLFLCVLPVGYTIVWVKPSWHCGPFSEYEKIYYILTLNIYQLLPGRLNFTLGLIASPAIVIPLLVLLVLIIYYLTSLTNSLREANNDLKIQLRRERTEERRKMFQLADTRRRAGSSAMENTPFARWKKALPSLPMSKSIDSDDRKTLTEETSEPVKKVKKRGGIFAKIVGMALDKKSDIEAVPEVEIPCPSPNNVDDETDTDFHETLPREILKIKDITIVKPVPKKRSSVEFKTEDDKKSKADDKLTKADSMEKKTSTEKESQGRVKPKIADVVAKEKGTNKRMQEKQTSESSNQSRQSDSIGSVIPVITISTTESDEEVISKKEKKSKNGDRDKPKQRHEGKTRKAPDLKSLRRQSSVESITEQEPPVEEIQPADGHKYQYSL